MKFRFCPSCGSELDLVGEGPDLGHPFCRPCRLVHYDNPGVTAFTFVEHSGRFLVLRRSQDPHRDGWDVPGGFVESGETPEEAVRRELYEETGLTARALELLGTYKSTYGQHRWTVDVGFRCRADTDVVCLSPEKSAYEWVDAARLPNLAFEGVRHAARELRSRLSAPEPSASDTDLSDRT